MKKPDKPAGGPASVGTPAKGTLFSGMPLLWEMLTASFYDDGSKRYRSTVLLICDGEAAKICLLDGDIGRQAWSTGETIEQALETLEDQLQRDAVSWQPGKKRESKKSRD
jgi:hypothetical protein